MRSGAKVRRAGGHEIHSDVQGMIRTRAVVMVVDGLHLFAEEPFGLNRALRSSLQSLNSGPHCMWYRWDILLKIYVISLSGPVAPLENMAYYVSWSKPRMVERVLLAGEDESASTVVIQQSGVVSGQRNCKAQWMVVERSSEAISVPMYSNYLNLVAASTGLNGMLSTSATIGP